MTARAPMPRQPLAVRLLALGVVQLAVLGLSAVIIGSLTRPPPIHDLTARIDDAVSRVDPIVARGDDAALADALEALASEHALAFTVYDARDRVVATSTTPPVGLPPAARRSAAQWARPHGPPPHGPLGRAAIDEGPPFDGPPLDGPALDGPPLDGPPFDGPPFDGPSFDGPPRDRPGPPPLGMLGPAPREHPPIVRWIARDHVLVARGEPPSALLAPMLMVLVGLLVIAAGALLTARWIVRPLERVAEAAKKVGQGDLTARSGIDRDDEIGTVARGFDHMAERVGDMLRAERELLANVSHELRTPLARVRVALDLASEGHTDALADVTSDLQELEGIVDDVLLAFRFERDQRGRRTGLPVGTLRETTLEEILSAVQRRFAARHPGRPLELDVAPDLPNVLADLTVLRRAIDNLLDNAHKYTPDERAPISLRARRSGEHVELVVSDRGVGIDPADLPRIFEPFFRAERSRARSAGGVGLGLALSRRIIEAHRGTIEVESSLGAGTTFTVRLEALLPRPSSRPRADG